MLVKLHKFLFYAVVAWNELFIIQVSYNTHLSQKKKKSSYNKHGMW